MEHGCLPVKGTRPGHPTPLETFARRLRERRRALDYTDAQMARSLGIGVSTYCTMERGNTRRISPDRIVALATLLGVDPNYLLGWDV